MTTARRLLVLVSIQLTVLAVSLGWGWLRSIPWWRHVHMDAWVLAAVPAGLVLSLLSWALFGLLRRLGQGQMEWFMQEFLTEVFGGLPLWALAGLALLSGLAEESLFRGTLLPEMGLWPSSVVFGILHTGDRRLFLAGLWSALVGAGLGWLYLATGNLAHCMMVHAASNLCSFWMIAHQAARGQVA